MQRKWELREDAFSRRESDDLCCENILKFHFPCNSPIPSLVVKAFILECWRDSGLWGRTYGAVRRKEGLLKMTLENAKEDIIMV